MYVYIYTHIYIIYIYIFYILYNYIIYIYIQIDYIKLPCATAQTFTNWLAIHPRFHQSLRPRCAETCSDPLHGSNRGRAAFSSSGSGTYGAWSSKDAPSHWRDWRTSKRTLVCQKEKLFIPFHVLCRPWIRKTFFVWKTLKNTHQVRHDSDCSNDAAHLLECKWSHGANMERNGGPLQLWRNRTETKLSQVERMAWMSERRSAAKPRRWRCLGLNQNDLRIGHLQLWGNAWRIIPSFKKEVSS